PDVLLPTLVLRREHDLADKPALIDGPSGRVVTYGELADLVRRFAGGLAARSFGPGDVLAIMAPNCPEYAVVFHGTPYAGGAITTINPSYTEREVHHQITDAQPRLLVTVSAFLDLARAAAKDTSVEEIFVIDDGDAPSWRDLLGAPLAAPVADETSAIV